jgi:uncharacterized protein YueI
MKNYTLSIVTISLVVFMNLINAQTKVDYAEMAEKIHSEIITIDTHVDTPLRMVRGMDITKRNDGKKDGSKLDFPV